MSDSILRSDAEEDSGNVPGMWSGETESIARQDVEGWKSWSSRLTQEQLK